MSELFEEKIMRFSEEEIKKLERELFSHGITWNEFEEQYLKDIIKFMKQ